MALYKILLHLVHAILRLRLLLFSVWSKVVILSKSIIAVGRGTRRILVDLMTMQNDAKSMKQLPCHVGLVIVEDGISCNDVAKLIVWSIGMGIPCVTLFDQKGWMKEMRHKINQHVVKYYELLLDDENTKLLLNCYNGVVSGNIKAAGSYKPVRINYLSNADGRQDIVTAAQKLCLSGEFNQLSACEDGINKINSTLTATQGFGDPELIVKFGAVDSLLGFLPWQIRLSEIMFLPSHRHITYSSFLSVIKMYSNSQQRFGK